MKPCNEAEGPLHFERGLSPTEGMALVSQSGVTVEARGNAPGDGDIHIDFHLPDGRCVEYTARMEDDYYGGSYNIIDWNLFSDRQPRDTGDKT